MKQHVSITHFYIINESTAIPRNC